MVDKDILKYLAASITLDKLTKSQVTLLIGDSVELFKKIYKGPLYTITKADEVKEFINNHQIPDDKPLVFEDISLMTSNVQTYLLKFIEEPPTPLLILASRDNVSPIILSRCRTIIKIPSSIVPKNKELKDFADRRIELWDMYTEAKRGGAKMEPEDLEELNSLELQSLKECPDYFYWMAKLRIPLIQEHTAAKYIKLL